MTITRRALALSAVGLLGVNAKGGALSGRRAPSFTLPDLGMTYYDLLDYRGKVVLLDFMQTSCPHCQTLAPTLERIKKQFGDRLVILSIVMPPDNTRTIPPFIAKHQITTPILLDCGQVAAAYLKVTPQRPQINIPHLFLVDAKGMIVEDWEYTATTRSIFEGDGLVPHIAKLAGPPKK